MPADERSQSEQLAELQATALAALRQQQEAFLAGVRAWREMLAKNTTAAPSWPDQKAPSFAPQPAELAEASYAFTAKLLAEQSQFLTELSKAMVATTKKA